MIEEMIRFAEKRLERLNQQLSEAIDLEQAARIEAAIAETKNAIAKLRSLG